MVQLWNNVRVAFGDQPDLLELAEKLSQNFESLYNEEVVSLFVSTSVNFLLCFLVNRTYNFLLGYRLS